MDQGEDRDTLELQRFRDKWKQEILKGIPAILSPISSSSPSASSSLSSGPDGSSSIKLQALSRFKITNHEEEQVDQLITIFSEKLSLPPEGDNEEVDNRDKDKMSIMKLPDELVMQVMTSLDVKSLERCSAACRLWYIIARDQNLPQYTTLCFQAWPLTGPEEYYLFGRNWRYMYLKRPRVRNDGIYISKNQYLRQGSTQGSYYQPVHEVVYYRYLRFFEDGRVVSALSAEPPKQVLMYLRPVNANSAAKNKVQAGTYMVDGEMVSVWIQMSEVYTSVLQLGLSSTALGRNDRLAVVRYSCRGGLEETDYNNLDVKRFHFAKLPSNFLAVEMAAVQGVVA